MCHLHTCFTRGDPDNIDVWEDHETLILFYACDILGTNTEKASAPCPLLPLRHHSRCKKNLSQFLICPASKFVPEWAVSGVVGLLWHGGCLCLRESAHWRFQPRRSKVYRTHRESWKSCKAGSKASFGRIAWIQSWNSTWRPWDGRDLRQCRPNNP